MPITAADRIVIGGAGVIGRPFGQAIEAVELGRRDRLERKEALGQNFDAAGIVELAPFGAQRGDAVALAPHLAAQFCQMLGLHGRIRT